LINRLVTYVPFERLHEIENYFLKNKDIIRPSRSIVFVDGEIPWQADVVKQRLPPDIEVRYGTWGNGPACVIDILTYLKLEPSNTLIVDSDNVLDPDFLNLEPLIAEKYDLYAIQNHDDTIGPIYEKRSNYVCTLSDGHRVFEYRIPGHYNGILNIGPKQAIRLGGSSLGRLSQRVLDDMKVAVLSIDFKLRRFLADETNWGTILYYSGIERTPWTYGSTHYQRKSPQYSVPSRYVANATACTVYGKKMMRRYRRYILYYLRYKLAVIHRAIRL
jgi:hypothetical protein